MNYEFEKNFDENIKSVVKYMFDDMGETFPFNKVKVHDCDDKRVCCTIKNKKYTFTIFEFTGVDLGDGIIQNARFVALCPVFMKDFKKHVGNQKPVWGRLDVSGEFFKVDLGNMDPTNKYLSMFLQRRIM